MAVPESVPEMRSDAIMYDETCSLDKLSDLSERGVGQLVLHECDVTYCNYSGYNDNDSIITRFGKGQCMLRRHLSGLATIQPSTTASAFPLY